MVEGSEYKVVHQELLCNLLLLSTSTYSQVKLTTHTRQINKSSSERTCDASLLLKAFNTDVSGEIGMDRDYACMSVCTCNVHVFAGT